MAAPYNPPIKNEDFKFRFALTNASDNSRFKVNPTISSGDFKVDIDGGGYNNLTTIPAVSPAGSASVHFQLSSTEMNGDVITIMGIDQTDPPEWADFAYSIITTV